MTAPTLPTRALTTPAIMLTVLTALLPAIAVGTWLAGAVWVLGLLAMCLLALLLEALALHLRGRDAALQRQDGSVLVTAVLLFLLLPTSLPWWQAATGITLAVVVGKHIFGGLGQNLFNPVALAYLGLMALLPASQSVHVSALQAGMQPLVTVIVALAILAGGAVVLQKRIVGWQVPVAMLLPTIILFYGFGLPLSHGVMLLAALFIATDPVTCPGTRTGKLIYGLLIALISAIMTLWVPYPEAIAAAILCGNAMTPTLDQLIRHDQLRSARENR